MAAAPHATLHLAADLSSVSTARHFVRDTLTRHGAVDVLDDAQLGVSELIANAVKHAGTEVVLTLTITDDSVLVSVFDGHATLRPTPEPQADPLAESGRGLQIVEAVAAEWGVTPREDGKTLWFRLPVSRGLTQAPLLQLHRRDQHATQDVDLPAQSSSG